MQIRHNVATRSLSPTLSCLIQSPFSQIIAFDTMRMLLVVIIFERVRDCGSEFVCVCACGAITSDGATHPKTCDSAYSEWIQILIAIRKTFFDYLR